MLTEIEMKGSVHGSNDLEEPPVQLREWKHTVGTDLFPWKNGCSEVLFQQDYQVIDL